MRGRMLLGAAAVAVSACGHSARPSEAGESRSPLTTRCAALRAEFLATLTAAERGPDNPYGIVPASLALLPRSFGQCVPAGDGAWVVTLDHLERGGCHGSCADIDFSLHHVARSGVIDGSFDFVPEEGWIVPYHGWSLELPVAFDANGDGELEVEVRVTLTMASAYSGDEPVTYSTTKSMRAFTYNDGAIEEILVPAARMR